MRKLDFISVAPNLSIFKAGSNKANFGGILFLIYIIILLLLAAIYIYDFANKDSYTFEYTFIKEKDKGAELKEDDRINEFLNTDFNFSVSLEKFLMDNKNAEELSDNFIMIDIFELSRKLDEKRSSIEGLSGSNFINIDDSFFDDCKIRKNYSYKRKLSILDQIGLAVFYRCNGTDCKIREEDKLKLDSYNLNFKYRGFIIDHQNSEEPIMQLPEDRFWQESFRFLENTMIIFVKWSLIQYEEKKGIFGKMFDDIRGHSNMYYGGDIKSRETYIDDGHVRAFPDQIWNVTDKDGNHFITLLLLLSNIFADNDKYTRSANSVLDVLANLAALGSTILSLVGLAYRILYSHNYDNYKIIENILTKQLRVNINPFNDKKDTEAKIELNTGLIEQDLEENDNKELIGEEKPKKGPSENINLPSPKFYDFLLNFFYFKCCRPSNKQSLINSCNNIVAKYITIEKLLYNQMRLEYLWKDYKWNNPQYGIKEKDDLLLELK